MQVWLSDLHSTLGKSRVLSLKETLSFSLTNKSLHLDTRLLKLSEIEIRIRRMTLRACIIYDR
jgi:hypothetical protein